MIARDTRDTWRKRLLPALLAGLAAPLILIIMGPWELYLKDNTEFPFGFASLLWPTLLVGLAAAALITGVLLLFRGKAFGVAVSLVIGLTLAAFLQGLFFNLNMGILTGDEVDWSSTNWYIIPNLLIWLVLTAAPVVLFFAAPKAWRVVIRAVPVVLLGMQAVSLVTVALTTEYVPKTSMYVSQQGMYEVSSGDNVLVFVIDRLDDEYVEGILKQDPAYFDKFDGFTRYTNHTSVYCRTYPSVTYLLAAKPQDPLFLFDKAPNQYFDEAYDPTQTAFLPALRGSNYTTKIYAEENYAFLNAEQLSGLADNVRSDGTKDVKTMNLLVKMLNYSAFKYSPHALKPTFFFSYDVFARTVEIKGSEYGKYTQDDLRTYQLLKEQGLAVREDKNNFMYLHFKGSHAPYKLDANTAVTGDGDVTGQTMGVFNIIYEYLNQMKAKGLYDNATVIITGDHGESDDAGQPLTQKKTTALFFKPSGSAGTPLATDDKPVSHANFQATVIEDAGIVTDVDFGKSYAQESEDAVRRFLYKIDYKSGRHVLEEYAITGDANDFEHGWTFVKEHPILDAFNH